MKQTFATLICTSKTKKTTKLFIISNLSTKSKVAGKDQLYIENTDNTPEKIVARDPATGEEFLIFELSPEHNHRGLVLFYQSRC